MAAYVYPAVFHPNADDGSFTITFPDLPNCITEGKDLADTFIWPKIFCGCGWIMLLKTSFPSLPPAMLSLLPWRRENSSI